MKKKNLFIDIDDTIADFMTPWKKDVKKQLKQRLIKTNNNEEVVKSLVAKIDNFLDNGIKMNLTNEEKQYFVYPQSRKNFLLNLKPIPGACCIIEKLKEHFDIKILTKSSHLNVHSYYEKRIWVESYYGLEMCEHLYFVPDKNYIKGDYLIDDNLWPGFSGTQLQFGQPGLETWIDVYNKLKELEKFN